MHAWKACSTRKRGILLCQLAFAILYITCARWSTALRLRSGQAFSGALQQQAGSPALAAEVIHPSQRLDSRTSSDTLLQSQPVLLAPDSGEYRFETSPFHRSPELADPQNSSAKLQSALPAACRLDKKSRLL